MLLGFPPVEAAQKRDANQCESGRRWFGNRNKTCHVTAPAVVSKYDAIDSDGDVVVPPLGSVTVFMNCFHVAIKIGPTKKGTRPRPRPMNGVGGVFLLAVASQL